MWNLSQSTVSISPTSLKTAQEAVKSLKARSDIGFLDLGQRAQLWSSSESRGKELRKSAFRMVVLGMGGSSLGGRALIDGLRKFESPHSVEFIDNVDSDRFWRWLKSEKDLQNIHWVIVSKSGNTIETLTMAEFVDQHLRVSGFKKLSSQATVISEIADNPLTRWAKKEGVVCLEIPKDVGGRYSVLSPVGLLPAAFYGLDLSAMQSGVEWAVNQDELIAQLTAHSLESFNRGEWITLFWSYADGLRNFGLWVQQLWAESLAKAQNRQGRQAPRVSTPLPCIGSSDQHSILQQVMEGTRDKFIWFLRVKQSERSGPTLERSLFDCQQLMLGKTMGELFAAMADATRDALAENHVQSLTLETDALNEESLCAGFMLLQMVVGAIGEAIDIDAFNQPGVELGKVLARKILSGQS